jgi:hypothetical protein
MAINEKQRLCGGTFFTLLLQARKPRTGIRQRYMSAKDGLSEPEMLIALAKIVLPDFSAPLDSMEATIKGNAFDYKSCKNAGGTYFPFGDSAAIQAFEARIRNDYRSALISMSDLIDAFIDVGGSIKKDERLVRALVELVCLDDSIDHEQAFYINESGVPSKKTDFFTMSELSFQPFLLGVFHYAVCRTEGNTIGQETFDAWCPSQGGGQRIYTATLGENLSRPLHLSCCGLTAPVDEAEITDSNFNEGVAEPNEQAASGNVPPSGAQQIVNNHPAFFNINVTGNHNSFFNQVDTVIIQNGERKDER